MTRYIANAFSPSMIPITTSPITVTFRQISRDEFCNAVNNAINAVGHASTVTLINQLCNSNLSVNRISIRANHGDEIYIISLTVRLEEGRVLTLEELQQLLNQNRITFILATVQ